LSAVTNGSSHNSKYIWVPDLEHEAMRDLVRARLDAVRALRRARQQLSGFLLRQGCHYGRSAWTKLHRRWLAGLKFEQAVRASNAAALPRPATARPAGC
jgi:transposase